MSAEHVHQYKDGYYGHECECGSFIAYGCEPWVDWEEADGDDTDHHGITCICETCIQNHPERDYDPFDNDDPDEWEMGIDCGIFRDGGAWYCGAVGSEQCDECPNSNQIGRKRWHTPKKVIP